MKHIALYFVALAYSLTAYSQQGVNSISASPTSVSQGQNVNVTAQMNMVGTQVSGTVVFEVIRSDGTTEAFGYGLPSTMPSTRTMTYSSQNPGSNSVRAFVSGVYTPTGQPYPTSFTATPCTAKTFTISAPTPVPTNSPLGTLQPAGWAELAAGNTSETRAVGATSGELSVGPSGDASYRIPLWVTPGTSGMQPDLSLVYSSNGGNGLLGQGWSLSGLSAISRGPQSALVDGAITGVNFSASDRFFLDGQRLILVSGTYGSPDSEYRTEVDSFSRIVARQATGTGPTYFEVWTKSGLKLEYGNNSNARRNAYGRT